MNFSRHCDLCDNRISSLEKGLTCNLTNKKPDFNNTCSKITLDKKFQEILEIANIELEILRRNKKSIHWTFYSTIIGGFLLIIGGYFFSDWTIHSIFLWYVKIGIIGAGFTFLGIAYSKLNGFRKKEKKARFDKLKIDETINKYGIEYNPSFDFEKKIHGIQEVNVNLEFKNWTKKRTTTPYKINC
ncbi:hypothetical protein [Lacinutrix sp. MedPE-SW]|uniref:hypothetical protein n=1 Tax=Lacinutrix sp. MedPE-SW TaxID=1860087 RepID=UPI0009186A9E|nr:hypothetical protein [Lacinutrix sp. MedPE-SW]OIQ18225.1 MAG: hypothetical protein BM549_12300 [Lacinutrix sp. MedPE-SW]